MQPISTIILSLALVSGVASADVVHLVNGDRLTGVVTGNHDGMVAFESKALGNLEIAERHVASIDRTADARDPSTASERPVSAPLGTAFVDVVAAEPMALAAPAGLETTAELSLVVADGNTNTEDLNIVVASKLERGRLTQLLGVNVGRAEAENVTTKDQLDVDYEARWAYRPTWYALGNVEYFRDDIKGIDQRVTVGAGVGHTFWESERGALNSDIGMSEVFEELRGASSENNPAFRWGLDYNYWLEPERLEFFHKHRLLWILDSARGEVWDSGSGIRFYVNDRIQTNLRLDIRHETEPQPGAKKTDVTYAIGVGVKL